MGSWIGGWLALPIALAHAGAALAQGVNPARAEEAFERGWALLEAGDWVGSCAHFEKSMALDPTVATELRIAHCREQEGKLATAWRTFERARERNADTADETRRQELDAYAKKELDRVLPRLPRLRLLVEPRPAGLEIELDGQVLATSLELPSVVDPGEHVLEATAPGYRPARATVIAREGVTLEVPLALLPETPRATPNETQEGAAVVLGTLGVASLVTAGGLGIYTLVKVGESDGACDANDLCSAEGVALREEARDTQTAGLVMLGVGGAALASGLALYLTAPSPSGSAHVRVHGTGAAFELRY